MDKTFLEYMDKVYNLTGSGNIKEDFSNTGEKFPKKYLIDWKKDCGKFSDQPLPNILPAVEKIIVIGDLHGDWKMTIDALKLGKVIDDDLNWIGGETIVVQVGDQIDRCRGYNYKCSDKRATVNDEASDIKILKLFSELNKKAQKEGGAVYSLLGNHELMNVLGDLRYVSYEGLKEFENYEIDGKKIKNGEEARRKAFERGGEIANFLACTRQSALIIGSNLFVHGGIMPELAEKYQIKDINTLIRKWLLNKIGSDEELNKIIKSSDYSPFWFRLFGQMPKDLKDSNDYCQMSVDPVLDIYHVNNIIVGHTPQSFTSNDGINSTCDKKIWRVDVGMSDAFTIKNDDTYSDNRVVQILQIKNDKEFSVIK